jgi:hypothetical protein
MNLVTILNQVLLQSGFLERGSFVSSADPDDKQMVAIANRAAYEIMNYFPWPKQRKTFTVTLNAGQTRYTLPTDFQSLVPDSAWEQDGERQVEFPVPDRRWFMYKFTNWSDGGTLRVRMYGNEIEVHDDADGETFNFEYISKWVVKAQDGTPKELFSEDTDTFDLDDQLLILGIQAHWQQAKLMPSYQEHFANYYRKMSEAIGRANGGRTIGGTGRGHMTSDSPYYPLWRPAS